MRRILAVLLSMTICLTNAMTVFAEENVPANNESENIQSVQEESDPEQITEEPDSGVNVPEETAVPAEGEEPASEILPEETPVPTEEPAASEEPAVTDEPAASEEPAVSEDPAEQSGMPEEGSEALEDEEESEEGVSEPITVDASEYILQAGSFIPEEGSEELGLQDTTFSNWTSIMNTVVRGMENRQDSIYLYNFRIPTSQALKVFAGVVNRNPQLFFVANEFGYRYSGGYIYELMPRYKSMYSSYDSTLFENAVKRILSGVNSSWTQEQKALYLHDVLVTTAEYDLGYNNYNAYNALVDHSVVCHGYALAYMYLCRRAGLDCEFVSSDLLNHAWNIITINGGTYYVDCTWDDPCTSDTGHLYSQYCDHENFLRSQTGLYNTGHTASDWVNALGEKLYGKYNNTKYDNAYFINSIAPIYSGSSSYLWPYIEYNSNNLYVRNFSSNTSSRVASLPNDSWPETSKAKFWSVVELNGKYYVSGPKKIYEVTPSGTVNTAFVLDSYLSSRGNIYGLTVSGDQIYYKLYGNYDDESYIGTYKATISNILPRVSSVSLSQSSAELYEGESLTLNAIQSPSNAQKETLVWTSGNTSVATVSNGTVKAVKAGTAVITVRTNDGRLSASCTVTVKSAAVALTGIALNKTRLDMTAGDYAYLSVTFTPTNATDKSVVWTSSDSSVASVDAGGRISAGKAGNAVITAEAANGLTASCEVRVSEKITVYHVIFNGNGADSGYMESLTYNQNQSYTLPANRFSRSGYRFIGWNTDPYGSGRSYSNRETVKNLTSAKDGYVTLFAQWQVEGYSIDYELDGGENHPDNPYTFLPGQKITFKNPSRRGYTFGGWYTDRSYKNKITGIKKGTEYDVTVYAKWTPISYKITYNLNGGKNPSDAPKKYTIENLDVILPEPSRNGYEFEGWYLDKKFESYSIDEITDDILGNITLYAAWSPIEYSIWYELDYDAENNEMNPETYTVQDKISLKNPTKPGFTFKGWYNDPTFKKKVTAINKGSVGDRVLYAKFVENKYKVAFNANGGKGKGPKTMTVTYSQEFVIPDNTFTRKGYTFLCWNTRKDGEGDIYFEGEITSELLEKNNGQLTLYAEWLED